MLNYQRVLKEVSYNEGAPSSLDGLFHGKSEHQMDDLGVAPSEENPWGKLT